MKQFRVKFKAIKTCCIARGGSDNCLMWNFTNSKYNAKYLFGCRMSKIEHIV